MFNLNHFLFSCAATTTKRIRVGLALMGSLGLLCFQSAHALDLGSLEPGWSGEAFYYQGDIWIRSYYYGVGQFDYRIGAGGAIAEMRSVSLGYQQMMPPWGNSTDRVVQSVWWDMQLTVPWAAEASPDTRFNLDQAGSDDNLMTPTISVRITSSPVPQVDVYSTPMDQFLPNNRPYLRGKASYLTRYRLVGEGNLMIRRVMLVGQGFASSDICDAGDWLYWCGNNPVPFNDFYIEAWTPFKTVGASPTFANIAFSLDQNGNPLEAYTADYFLNVYRPERPVGQTQGYAVAYTDTNSTAVGVVIGKNQVAGGDGDYRLNAFYQDGSLMILPGIWSMHTVTNGSVIDQTLVLVPKNNMNADLSANLYNLVENSNFPAPRLYAPYETYGFTGELAQIMTNLTTNMNNSYGEVRSEHLGKLGAFVDASAVAPVYGYYNWSTGEHLVSLSPTEGGDYGHTLQGVRFRIPVDSGIANTTPLYRCYYPNRGKHFVSTDPSCEGATNPVVEGRYGYIYTSQISGTVPLYRFYNYGNSDSLATTDYYEGSSNGYAYEGLLGFVFQ